MVPVSISHSDQMPSTAPVAIADVYQVARGQQLRTADFGYQGVLNNDSWQRAVTPTLTITSPPSNGTATIGADGNLVYTPNASFAGRDTLTYKIEESYPASETGGGAATLSHAARVEIHVTNEDPYAFDGWYSMKEGGSLMVSAAEGVLQYNPVDSEGDLSTVSLRLAPAHGTLSLASNGSFSYQPTAGYNTCPRLM